MVKKLNENKAITLIALIITIVIILILCGVTIGPILNKEGIVEKSKYAKEIDRCAKIEEEKKLWEFENAMKESKEELVSKEEFLKSLGPDNKNLLTSEEQEIIRKTGKITVANKKIKFWNTIESLSFISESVTLVKGGEGTLRLNVDDLNESDLLWECDNNDVITINQGKIISQNNGKANVVCKLSDNNNVSARCTVTVVDGSDMYAEGTGNTDNAPLKFCNIPDDCKAIINYSIRGTKSEPRHISHMDELRKSEGIKLKNKEVVEEGGFYTDWYYRLEDSFGNTTDYYWFYGNFACFTDRTNISTPKGMKSIENIKKGDEVYSLNIETKQKEVKKVIQTFKHIVNTKLVKIYIEKDYIECTTEHPLYEKNKGWINAIELKEGNILVTEDGIEKRIEKIETSKNNNFINVYNFEVEDNHNYFVGNNKVLVHNPPEPTGCSNEGIKYKGESIGK